MVILLGVALFYTPHLAIHDLKKAVADKDAATISSYIDYPALRESLKAQFTAQVVGRAAKRVGDNPFDALGVALATAFINPMIDALVTPESISSMLQGQQPKLDSSKLESQTKSPSETDDADMSMSYETFNTFVVSVKPADSSTEAIEFIFKRDGILFWKLSALHLFLGGSVGPSASVSKSAKSKAPPRSKDAGSTKSKDQLIVTVGNKRFQESDFTSRIYYDAILFDVVWDTSDLTKPTRAVKGILVKGIQTNLIFRKDTGSSIRVHR